MQSPCMPLSGNCSANGAHLIGSPCALSDSKDFDFSQGVAKRSQVPMYPKRTVLARYHE